MTKRPRTSCHTSVVDVWKREFGEVSTRRFAHRFAASEDLVLRLDILRKLDKHRGCVNTVSFNADGDVLVSGSDDTRIILWNWETGQVKLSFHSGHENNVFQAKFVPYTDDRTIVTSAADGKVRLAQILESRVETKLLSGHGGRVHKLAIEPESPHTLYTCAEDGVVQHIDLRAGTATSLFTCKALHSESYFSIVPLNAIAIDPRNPNLFAVGGSDQFARLFDIRQYQWDGTSKFDRPVDFFCPPHLVDDDNVGITGLAFSYHSELLVTYSDEDIYLFPKDIGLGPDPNSRNFDINDSSEGTTPDKSLSNDGDNVKAAPQAYKGHRNSATVKGVNFFGPKSEYVVSGSDCGRIFMWKKKGGELVRVMEADTRVVNCIESHPHDTVLASSGIESDIKIWIPRASERAILPTKIQKRVRHIGLISFGGFYGYDDGDDFLSSDADMMDDEDDEEEDDDDDTDSSDGDEAGEDNDSCNYDTDDCIGNEEVEDNEGDGCAISTFLRDSDDNTHFGSVNSCDNEAEGTYPCERENDCGDIEDPITNDHIEEVEDASGFESDGCGPTYDPCSDINDVDDCSDFSYDD